jgi:hypothetical protein
MMIGLAAVLAILASGPPGYTIRPCADGILIASTGGNLPCRVYRHGPPLEPVTFADPGMVCCVTFDTPEDEFTWRWDGYLVGDPTGRHTVIVLPEGAVVTLWLPLTPFLFGPVLTHHTIHRGDWNMDGAVNSNDISAFLTSWLTPPPEGWDGQHLPGDFNADGQKNSNDISAFLSCWLEGVN